MLRNISERRSIRAFKDEQISERELDAILSAGTWAPSGMNLQGWKIVSIQSRDLIEELNTALRLSCLLPLPEGSPDFMRDLAAKASDPAARFVFNCPTYILVTYGKENMNAMADSSLALGSMMLAASSLGVGTCWHNMPARLTEKPPVIDFIKRLGLPEDYRIYGTLAVGYPTETPEAPARKPGTVIKL